MTMSIPALAVGNSPKMRVEALPEPKLMLPGCFRHSTTKSCAVAAATSAAMAPLAPGLFSTTAGTSKILFRPSAIVRALWSVAEPAPNGTRMRIGPLGKVSARTGGARPAPIALSTR
jgi:hypothetical protein